MNSHRSEKCGAYDKGGLKTKVYIVELTGFDMHYSQCSENDPLQGRHAELLTSLGDAMKVFQADLNAMQVDERVVTMTFSEFGRRIKSNASYGTDHGDAAPLFISGTCINPGFFGDNPEIPEDTELAYGVAMQHDFRNVYGSILEDWFEVPVETVKNLLFQNYVKIPFLNPCTVVNATSDYKPALYDIEVNPNPAIEYIDIKFNCKDEHVRLSLFNGVGQLINTLLNRKMTKGTHSNRFSVSLLPPGVYYVHFTFQNGVVKTKMFTKLAI